MAARVMEQEKEWSEAQNIKVNVDLVAAAKQQLQFLAAVDRNRWLYQGPGLHTAIYRYNAFWLPLLAKHSEAPLSEGPLVVPLDCEWIWHCHRLNPVRYQTDCEELYGKILDNRNVVSTTKGTSKRDTEEIWKKLYPGEPYELDSATALEYHVSDQVERSTKYDLVSAAERQTPFFYQVSRPHMYDDLYLEGAVARYKGFLHLIKRNKERSIRSFTVPTYDVDLIWHTHQLHPVSYCNDLLKIIGKVLEHDDTDSDRTKGKKLDNGFSRTTKQWEDMYGSRYWRAGAMYRGSAPSPIQNIPSLFNRLTKKVTGLDEEDKLMHLPEPKMIEVMLEFVSVKNLPEGHEGSLSVSFSKTQPDTIFDDKRSLTILSESGVKQVASFYCQPDGDLLFELVSTSSDPSSNPVRTLGSVSISLGDLMLPESGLIMEKWLEMMPTPDNTSSKPILLRAAMSTSSPAPAHYVLHMVRSRPLSACSCFPLSGRVQSVRDWTRVIDVDGKEVLSLQMRDVKKSNGDEDINLSKEVIGIFQCGEIRTLADYDGTEWSLRNSSWSLLLQKPTDKNDHILELTGHHTVKFYPGRRLEYETKNTCEKHEQDFVTAVEFSAENPYGKAVALLNLNSGIVRVNGASLLLPATILSFILCDIVQKEGHEILFSNAKSTEKESLIQATNGAGCGVRYAAGCGGGCGSIIKSGACGGCNASGCGVGYGGSCGSIMKSGSCGGCGSAGGCGSIIKSGGCGVFGTGGCGTTIKSGACGTLIKSGACGTTINSGACGTTIDSGACGISSVDAGTCGTTIKSGACGVSSAGTCGTTIESGVGGCGTTIKSGACGVPSAGAGTCGTTIKSGACGTTVESGACGTIGAGGCGTTIKSGACGTTVESGACGVLGAGGCETMIKSGACEATIIENAACGNIGAGGCGATMKSGACGTLVESGACGVFGAGGCGTTIKGGACGSAIESGACGVFGAGGCGATIKGGACGSAVESGGCGVFGAGGCGVFGASVCGSVFKSGACGGFSAGACGSAIESGACGALGAGGCGSIVGSGGCGTMAKGGACAGLGSGGCGSTVESGACGGCGATSLNM